MYIVGDFIPIEEKKIEKKGNRLVRDDPDDCSDDEERIDMSAITGVKEREERKEKFYSAQQECMLMVLYKNIQIIYKFIISDITTNFFYLNFYL